MSDSNRARDRELGMSRAIMRRDFLNKLNSVMEAFPAPCEAAFPLRQGLVRPPKVWGLAQLAKYRLYTNNPVVGVIA